MKSNYEYIKTILNGLHNFSNYGVSSYLPIGFVCVFIKG